MTRREQYIAIREQIGSKREVARRLGIHYMTLQKREREGSKITDEHILALLALHHGITPADVDSVPREISG